MINALCNTAFPVAPPRVVLSVAVPEHVADPLLNVAVVGAAVQDWPRVLTTNVAPAHTPPLMVTVAVVPAHELLNVARVQVPDPLKEPPLPDEIEATPVADQL